jgi:hypothetical protein
MDDDSRDQRVEDEPRKVLHLTHTVESARARIRRTSVLKIPCVMPR